MVQLEGVSLTQAEMRDLRKITIIACGTAWHAGLIGKYIFEEIARVPVDVEYGSEYRYQNPVVEPNTLAPRHHTIRGNG
jgi:glucosamine--fructose-6-phosphate aminotransferase (isomerizing)